MEEVLSAFNLELFGQLALATFLGALIGLERSLARKEAGMRTFAVVSLGSALFSIVSIHALKNLPVNGLAQFDPTRIAAQIVTGVGFIGAGVVIFAQSKLQGVTTAAGLWLSAAIGMAVGFKFYAASIFTTFLALLVFAVLWYVEHRIRQMSFTHHYHATTEKKEDI
ncbi:MAG: MgtC/SapB family protein [bacterium]|nr:MgtC/SapB family protein [bacterium]